MPVPKLEVLVEGIKFGEGPRWRDGRLWYSDFYHHRVSNVDIAGRVEHVVEVPQRPSGLGWTTGGELLVVSMLDRRVLRFDGKALHLHADLAALAGGLCNDMVVDVAGRAYVGNFGYDRHNDAPPRRTRLIRVEPDGRASALISLRQSILHGDVLLQRRAAMNHSQQLGLVLLLAAFLVYVLVWR